MQTINLLGSHCCPLFAWMVLSQAFGYSILQQPTPNPDVALTISLGHATAEDTYDILCYFRVYVELTDNALTKCRTHGS